MGHGERNRDENREPVIMGVRRVIRGNSGRGLRAFLVAGFVFINNRDEQYEKHFCCITQHPDGRLYVTYHNSYYEK